MWGVWAEAGWKGWMGHVPLNQLAPKFSSQVRAPAQAALHT